MLFGQYSVSRFMCNRIIMRKTVLVFVILGFIVNAGNAFAQEKTGGGITISPLTFELTANPGDTIANKIKVFNPSDSPISIKMEVEDFKPVGEEGKVVTTTEEDEDSTYSLRKWIKIIPNEFTLEVGGQKSVDFIIEVPQDAEPGGKYGSILAGISGSLGEGITGASVSQKTGSLVLLMVAGDLKEKLIIKDFTVPSFQEYGPVPFEIRFENKGSVHAKPKGYIVITDWFGKNVAELEFPQKNVMPEATRKIETEWNTKWLLGKYTASVIGVYGASNENLTSQVITFWVLPWKLMLGVFVVLLIILFLFFKSRKRLRLAAKILFKGEHHAHK